MGMIKKLQVASGVFWVEIPKAQIFMLCGCPADAVKLLKKRGLIESVVTGGIAHETGPNVILLSEVLMQNGSFSNLTEFPAMQMLYLQGMVIPNHPNNTGIKPMLVGIKEQVDAQMAYFYCGNYGLIDKAEIMAAGIGEKTAEEMLRMKLHFAFGRIKESHEILEARYIPESNNNGIADETVAIRNNVFITKKDFNIYEIAYKDGEIEEKIEVNLNLKLEERYEAPYQLGYHLVEREYFAVVHSGEGDGWDINRPCMASIIIYQGKVYIIDAGPNILTSLNYLGISVNEIEGIFHTHAHDDHFAGLTTLIRTDRKFKYFATPLVRKSVTKKLCALMSIPEESFHNFFDVQDLTFDSWSDIEGLEVMPVFSPHPVDTNIFFFRVYWNGEYKTYAHLADVISFDAFSKMYQESNPEKSIISEHTYQKVKEAYLRPTHLKKIDIGGGMIHGNAEDYRQDHSDKIVLAHTHRPLTVKEREIGSSAAFGMVDTLIPSNKDYLTHFSYQYLKFYFPDAPEHEIQFLINHPITSFNAGTILFKKGGISETVYLILTGSVEFADSISGNPNILPAGSLIDFYSHYLNSNTNQTYRTASHINALEIPIEAYRRFISRNNLYAEIKRVESNIVFLKNTWLFGEVVSFPILTKIAKTMEVAQLPTHAPISQKQILYLVRNGQVRLTLGDNFVETLQKGNFFGAEEVWVSRASAPFYADFEADTELISIPFETVKNIPIVYWKFLETYEKRLKKGAGK